LLRESFPTRRSSDLLLNNTVYYWRVRASNTAGEGDWSSIWRFTTVGAPLPVPATPQPMYPAHSSLNIPLNTAVSWDASADAEYRSEEHTSELQSREN